MRVAVPVAWRAVAAIDPCSSARWFDGWSDHDPVVDLAVDTPATVGSRTWLLGVGWRRHGLVTLSTSPPKGRSNRTATKKGNKP
jgi:hypothetical protein